jgi:hypothetical protein
VCRKRFFLLAHEKALFRPTELAQQQKEYSNLKSWGKWRVLIVGKTILFKTNLSDVK